MRFPEIKSIVFIALLLIFPKIDFAQGLQFSEEVITVQINGNRARLTGQYLFRNPGQQELATRLYFPFPITSQLLYPDSIAVSNMQTQKQVGFSEGPAGIYFPVKIPPVDSVWYQVVYAQHLTDNSFIYILTTTHAWNRPLRSADYIVKIPDSFQLADISIPIDSTAQTPQYQEFYIHREFFMPDTDLVIHWEKK